MSNPGKRVLLISPHGHIKRHWFPMALGYLKSNIPARHQVELLDCTLEEMPPDDVRFAEKVQSFQPDVVGISVSSFMLLESLHHLSVVKRILPHICTVMGGPHPSIYGAKVIEHEWVDFVLQGECELSFPLLLDLLGQEDAYDGIPGLIFQRGGAIIQNPIQIQDDLDQIKPPDYHALQLNRYLDAGYNYGGIHEKSAPIWVTRGCPFRCKFCAASMINGHAVRIHSLSYLDHWIDTLRQDFDIRQFAIIDDMFTYNKEFAKSFCRHMIQRKIKGTLDSEIIFTTPNGVHMASIDDELLLLMKQAGWKTITIAPESGSRKILRKMKKGINPDKVPAIIDRIRHAGLYARCFFIMGYPGETREDFGQTLKLIRKCRMDAFDIARFIPFPGTPVFDELVESKQISSEYIPIHNKKFFVPFQTRLNQKTFTNPGFEKMDLFFIHLWEYMLLALRNPRCIRFFVSHYGVMNIFKILFSIRKASG